MSLKNIKCIVVTTSFICLLISCGSSKKAVVANSQVKKDTVTDSLKNKTVVVLPIPLNNKPLVIEPTDSEENQSGSEKIDTITHPKVEQQVLISSVDSLSNNQYFFDHSIWDQLLQKNVDEKGTVDYVAFKKDKKILNKYLNTLSSTMPNEHWRKTDKLAYWMNAYNAFTIKLILDNYPIKSIKDINDPWDIRFFKLGKKWYNLNEIEHQILRKMEDPRIHFGINCASFSCPSLSNRAFTAENVHQQLDKLTSAFINDPVHNRLSSDTIVLSKIFSWFAKDFRANGSLIDFLNTYAQIEIHPKAKKSFLDYNWNLNGK